MTKVNLKKIVITEIARFGSHKDAITHAQFSNNGKFVITASLDKTAKLWCATTKQLIFTLQGHEDFVEMATFSPNSQLIGTAGNDSTAKIWDSNTGELLRTLKTDDNWVTSVAFSPDSRRVLTTNQNTTAKIWDTESGQLLLTIPREPKIGMRSGCFSPNGKKILYVSGSFTFLYNSRTGKQLSRMCHNERCYSAAFSLDGRRIVTSARAEVAIWDAYHKKGGAFPLEVYGGHESCFFDKVSFSPNGQFILTTDGTVRLWDVKSGELQSFPECGKWVYSAVFSPNSQQLLTAHEDGVARLWQISFSE